MSFFEELKRRNVIRVAIAYVVAAWLLLQLTDVLVDLLGLPDTAGKYVILLLVIGFPLALFFAWAFEMTPQGIKLEKEVDRTRSIAPATGRKLDRGIIVVLALAVVFFIYDKFSSPEAPPPAVEKAAGRATSKVPANAAEPSIAVLPFINMSADPEQEYFSDGISEELLNLLVRVDGLKVASRTSSFVYKGENLNIPAIATELKVNHILEGSVRKAGSRVRITAQLIDVASDRHLWSESFDRELVDIFAIQDEIANAIVNALKTELGVGLKAVRVETATENLDAYDLYLKARGLFIARQNLDVSTRLLEKATELDPNFAEAWETLAAAHSVSASWLAGDGVDHDALSLAAAKKALEVDPHLSLAYAVMGQIPGAHKDLLEAINYYDKALENDPKNATAWLWRGITLKEIGHMERAITDFAQCLSIDPGYLNCKQHMAVAYLYWGKTDRATQIFEETLEENFHSTDDIFVAHYLHSGQRLTAFLLASTGIFGQYAPIKEWIEAIENPQQDQSARTAHWQRWADSQNVDICGLSAVVVALRLDRCYAHRNTEAMQSIWHQDAAYYRNSPAFKDLVNRHLMSYWQAYGFPPQCRPLANGDFECD